MTTMRHPRPRELRCVHGWLGRAAAGGFTLIELLVSVAILSLLAALLAPTLRRAGAMARNVQCATNTSQVGKASWSYAAANGGFVPRDVWPNQVGHYLFAARFLPHLGHAGIAENAQYRSDSDYQAIYEILKEVPVFRCPGVAEPDYALTYVINGVDFTRYKAGEGYRSAAAMKISSLPFSASDAMYLTEFNPYYPGQTPNGFGTYDVWVPGHVAFDLGVPMANPRMIRADDPRHQGAANMTFFDGHAETRLLDPRDISRRLLNPLDRTKPGN